jgi:hypothetical protein
VVHGFTQIPPKCLQVFDKLGEISKLFNPWDLREPQTSKLNKTQERATKNLSTQSGRKGQQFSTPHRWKRHDIISSEDGRKLQTIEK